MVVMTVVVAIVMVEKFTCGSVSKELTVNKSVAASSIVTCSDLHVNDRHVDGFHSCFSGYIYIFI